MIGYIKFENEIKIGDIELDFFKNKNEVYNTIVLAGENGCGKTTILNAIAAFQRGSYLHESSSVQKVMYLDENGKVHEILREKESLRYSKPGGIT
jgi:recombinational DNA repair ATPase RecF